MNIALVLGKGAMRGCVKGCRFGFRAKLGQGLH